MSESELKRLEGEYVAAMKEWLKQHMSVGLESEIHQRYLKAVHDYAEALEQRDGRKLPELHLNADELSPEKREALVQMFAILAAKES